MKFLSQFAMFLFVSFVTAQSAVYGVVEEQSQPVSFESSPVVQAADLRVDMELQVARIQLALKKADGFEVQRVMREIQESRSFSQN